MHVKSNHNAPNFQAFVPAIIHPFPTLIHPPSAGWNIPLGFHFAVKFSYQDTLTQIGMWLIISDMSIINIRFFGLRPHGDYLPVRPKWQIKFLCKFFIRMKIFRDQRTRTPFLMTRSTPWSRSIWRSTSPLTATISAILPGLTVPTASLTPIHTAGQ